MLILLLGRPKCIFDTKRVDRRPEKLGASSDFGEWKGASESNGLGF